MLTSDFVFVILNFQGGHQEKHLDDIARNQVSRQLELQVDGHGIM